MAIIILLSVAILSRRESVIFTGADAKTVNRKCIVIDAGHGGDDPGKIGINNALEKDINLSIAEKLKALLESQDYQVVMTRTTSEGLYQPGSKNMKVEDMRRRCEIITEAMPVFTVSIHQNSYTSPEVKGAQVFYYGQSPEGETLAKLVQKSLIERADPENRRQAKANDTYYLLKRTVSPTIIVECGFLSCPQEALLLTQDSYQNRLVWAIHMGVMEFLNGVKETDL